jgi:hypothetical protein
LKESYGNVMFDWNVSGKAVSHVSSPMNAILLGHSIR